MNEVTEELDGIEPVAAELPGLPSGWMYCDDCATIHEVGAPCND